MAKATDPNKNRLAFRREADFSYQHNTIVSCNAILKSGDVRIQLMAERIYKPGVLIRDVFLEGGDVLRCYRGRFRFTLEGQGPVMIEEGETIVVYPEQRMTIEALDKVNLLVYVVFEGVGVARYFDHLGFYNGLHGKTSSQLEVFREVKHRFESRESTSPYELASLFSDALVTYAHDFRGNGNVVLFDAIRQIRRNLQNRIVRLETLYDQLQIGHTSLHQLFVRAGLGSPAAFIREEQLRLVCKLLRETAMPIAEVAQEAGFISLTHFANFIKKRTGRTASDIRHCGKTKNKSEE